MLIGGATVRPAHIVRALPPPLAPSTWHLAPSTWHLAPGTWHLVAWVSSQADCPPTSPRPAPQERDTKERRHFSAFVNSKDFVMVAYGAPWCPWSRRMEPVWKG